MCLDFRFENIDRKGSIITETHVHNQFRTLCARARGCVHVHVFNFVMIGQNISNDGDKGVHNCNRPTFIEPSDIRE